MARRGRKGPLQVRLETQQVDKLHTLTAGTGRSEPDVVRAIIDQATLDQLQDLWKPDVAMLRQRLLDSRNYPIEHELRDWIIEREGLLMQAGGALLVELGCTRRKGMPVWVPTALAASRAMLVALQAQIMGLEEANQRLKQSENL